MTNDETTLVERFESSPTYCNVNVRKIAPKKGAHSVVFAIYTTNHL